MDGATIFTKTLAVFTVLGNIASFLFLSSAIVAPRLFDRASKLLADYAIALGFFLSAMSTIGSIIYAEVVGFPACILCWIQRIFMYPLMFLFGLAYVRKERLIIPYALLLSGIGGVVGVYHWAKDMLALYSDVTIPCPAVANLPSCDKIFVLEFGYVTIPMIALNAFILICIVMYASMRESRKE